MSIRGSRRARRVHPLHDPAAPRAKPFHRVDPVVNIVLDHRRPSVAQLDGEIGDDHRLGQQVPAPRRVEAAVAAGQLTVHDPLPGAVRQTRLDAGDQRRVMQEHVKGLAPGFHPIQRAVQRRRLVGAARKDGYREQRRQDPIHEASLPSRVTVSLPRIPCRRRGGHRQPGDRRETGPTTAAPPMRAHGAKVSSAFSRPNTTTRCTPRLSAMIPSR